MSVKFFHCLIVSHFIIGWANDVDIAKLMIQENIVPELIRYPPTKLLKVVYKSRGEVIPGSYWWSNQTLEPPTVHWDAEPNATYCLYMSSVNRNDPDHLLYPFTKRPVTTPEPPINTMEMWVVSNIPGNNLEKGKTLVFYTAAGPPYGKHAKERVVFLIYKQSTSNMTVKEHEFEEAGYNVPDLDNLTRFEDEYNLDPKMRKMKIDHH